MTCPRLFSTTIRSCSCPGGTSNVVVAPVGFDGVGDGEPVDVVDVPADVVDVPADDVDGGGDVAAAAVAGASVPSSGIRPRNSERPSGEVTVNMTRVGTSPSLRRSAIASPGAG